MQTHMNMISLYNPTGNLDYAPIFNMSLNNKITILESIVIIYLEFNILTWLKYLFTLLKMNCLEHLLFNSIELFKKG